LVVVQPPRPWFFLVPPPLPSRLGVPFVMITYSSGLGLTVSFWLLQLWMLALFTEIRVNPVFPDRAYLSGVSMGVSHLVVKIGIRIYTFSSVKSK
jgi:hypothetical protein